MRKKLLINVKRNWMSMKKSWSEDTLVNNKRELIIFRPSRKKPSNNVRPSSRSSHSRRLSVGLRRNTRRTSGTSSKSKRLKSVLVRLREIKRRNACVNFKSSRPPRIINSNLRLSVWLKRGEWRKTSRSKWLKNSPRMSVLSR